MVLKVGSVRVTDLVEAATEETRASVVASVVAGLQAAQLSSAEYLAVVGAIHALLAADSGIATVVVTATAVHPEFSQRELETVAARVASRTAQVVTPAPDQVSQTVELMVRWASPALWEQLHAALQGVCDAEET